MSEHECWEKTKMASLIGLLIKKSNYYNINQTRKETLLKTMISINSDLGDLDTTKQSTPTAEKIKTMSQTILLTFHSIIAQIEDIVNKNPSLNTDDKHIKIPQETIDALDEVIDQSTVILSLIIEFKDRIVDCNYALSDEVSFNEKLTRLSNTAKQLDQLHSSYTKFLRAQYYGLWDKVLSKYDLSSQYQKLYTCSKEKQREGFLKNDLKKLISDFLELFMQSRKGMILDIIHSWSES